MYRNRNFVNGSSTQTVVPTNVTNTLINTNKVESSENDNIIYYIVTGNIIEIRKLINNTNVNKIIDIINNYTALHYAVKLPNNNIVEYLMSCNADTSIKQNEGKDAIDLSIESNKRYLIDNLLKKNNFEIDQLYTKFDDLNYKTKNIERSNNDLKQSNDYLQKSNDQYVKKIEELKENNTKLNDDNVKIKRKLEDSDKAFSNLLKKVQKN